MQDDRPNAASAAQRAGVGRGLGVSAGAPWTSRIESVGVCLPRQRLSTRELMASCPGAADVDLEGLTGIRWRRVCSDDEDSHSLARDAALDCLAHSRHRGPDIEMLITCSITKYRGRRDVNYEPGVSFVVKNEIGAAGALHFDLSNACAGMLTGVLILDDFIRRGAVRRGMVVSGESITSLSRNATGSVQGIASPELASLTLGDAGAAVILERNADGTPGITACDLVTFAEYSDLCVARPCPHGPGAVMHTDAKALHQVAILCCVPSLRRALERSGTSWGEIDWVIPHQSSERAIREGTRYVSSQLGGVPKHIVYNLEAYGNTSSTTHFVALYGHLRERRIQPGQQVAMLCFASGLVVGAVVFTMDHLVEAYARPA